MKEGHDQVVAELEMMSEQLKVEQKRNLQLQNDLKSGVSAQRAINEVATSVSLLSNLQKPSLFFRKWC